VAFEIDWNELSPEECENLITALLTELYPQGRRIDGRGGDGGRDYETPQDGGWHRLEVKSWCREFGKSQRQQLKRSLQRTLAANPVKVTIVVPLDQNDAIIAWLARQQATTTVPLEWLGRTWLETQLAIRPHLVRAFARTSHERTLERLAEYHAEQAALPNGMPDAIDRYQRLQARTDEVDPHYRFITETAPGRTTIMIVPRTERSLQEQPITVSLGFAFPPDDPRAAEVVAAINRNLDYGDPVTVPAEYVASVEAALPGGLAKDVHANATVFMEPTTEVPWGTDGRIVLADAAGRPLQQLPVRFTSFSAGRRGFVLEAEDLTRSLRLEIRGPEGAGKGDIKVGCTPGGQAIPADLLGPLRFFEALRTAAILRVLAAGGREVFAMRVAPIGEFPAGGLEFVEALARVQERTGVFFPLPHGLSEQEANAVLLADSLLRDGQVRMQGGRTKVVVTRARARELLQAFPSGQIALWNPNESFAIRVGGHEVQLGPVSIYSPCAQFDAAALRRHLGQQRTDPGDQLLELSITVQPQDGPTVRLVA
jgi:hypothetical protein